MGRGADAVAAVVAVVAVAAVAAVAAGRAAVGVAVGVLLVSVALMADDGTARALGDITDADADEARAVDAALLSATCDARREDPLSHPAARTATAAATTTTPTRAADRRPLCTFSLCQGGAP